MRPCLGRLAALVCAPFLVVTAASAQGPTAAVPAAAVPTVELDRPPEDPLPLPPPPPTYAPASPVVMAPDVPDLLRDCAAETTFIDCIRQWQPPPPPPPPAPRPARTPPPAPADAPRAPAEPGAASTTPPPRPPEPQADRATYEALVNAVREAGLEGKILLPDPPTDGNTVLKLDPTPQQRPASSQ